MHSLPSSLLACTFLAVVASAQTTARVNLSSSGAVGDVWGSAYRPVISADGTHVAFTTSATNLVPNDTNGMLDVFVRDLVNGTTVRASVGAAGEEGNQWSKLASISADGRYVAFESDATTLVPNDTNLASDIFVHDTVTHVTERVSLRSNGSQSNGFSFGCSISADGRFVAFYSSATNLVPQDTNAQSDVFVRDRELGTTVRISKSSSGQQALQGSSVCPVISGNGRFVAYASDATNLVPNDTNFTFDIFVTDRETGVTERVNVDSNGIQANDFTNIFTSISHDGRYVAFESFATNLAEDTTPHEDVYLHDRQTHETRCVSVDSTGLQANGPSDWQAISGNGRFVAFTSYGDNLVPGGTPNIYEVFLHDIVTRKTERVSVTHLGQPANHASRSPWLDFDGRVVVFTSGASNLVPGDTVAGGEFIRDRATDLEPFCFGDGSLLTPCPCAPPNSVPNPSGAPGNGCANSLDLAGARLTAEGLLVPDTVVFTAEIAPSYLGFAFLVKGDQKSLGGIANGDGVRCVSGALIRVGGHNAGTNGAAVGTWTYPNDVQTMPITDITLQGPGSAWYQVIYRNATAGFCSAGVTNWTNGVSVTWPN